MRVGNSDAAGALAGDGAVSRAAAPYITDANAPPATDEALVAAVARGDEIALGALYDRYAASIYSLALRITGDRLTAQEVAQDTFLRLWKYAKDFDRERGAFGAWLFAIARRRSLDVLRSRQRQVKVADGTFISDGGTLPEPSRGDASEQIVLAHVITEAVATLPRGQRQAIELAYFGGLTQQQIATQTGEPLGTVKSRMRTAMETLRTRLHTLHPYPQHEDEVAR
ncbi:MAG: sigma-70 family RNA polymerase sigma factor [Thermomicrobia bacterium]|nr:sigma-70 family RNA polymerase sigma factor [Thermomicrobia bacterium]MCA1724505.1 sigma-70 family RNA polymerase sigma factor [Thermomicrobia bacterium]